MRFVRVVDTTRKSVLGGRVRVADDFLSRTFGLLGRPAPRPGEGLLLSPCRAVHMLGMRYPLDIAFLDRRGTILALHPGLRPGLRLRWHRSAMHTLELPAGTLAAGEAHVGDQVTWLPVEQAHEAPFADAGASRQAESGYRRNTTTAGHAAAAAVPVDEKESA